MHSYFSYLSDFCVSLTQKNQYVSSYFSAEEMDFARLNHSKIRQSGFVKQGYLLLNLIEDEKEAKLSLGLSFDKNEDEAKIKYAFSKLNNIIDNSPKNPYVFYNNTKHDSFIEEKDELCPKEEILSSLLNQAKDIDLVGYFIFGPIYRGYFNSNGQKNWFKKSSFMIDTSIYYKEDQAIKQNYASTKFDEKILIEHISQAKSGLELFSLGKKTIEPQLYDVYFAPSAVYEILSLLNFGGFSYKSLQTKSSPLLPIIEHNKTLNEKFSLYENTLNSLGPNFTEDGFLKPDKLSIIENGQLKNTLISPKTAQEFKISHNGAENSENLNSIEVSSGDLEKNNILSTLNNGLFINNLWYLNYSDKNNGNITGMTRFLCYTVKNGKPEKSFGVMRFDESIYNIFGKNLLFLTKERELILDNSTYEERSTSSAMLPGIIVKNVRFTL